MSRDQHHTGATDVRVLHVDDDPDALASVGAALERTGSVEVMSESTVEAGLARVTEAPVDCVVSAFDTDADDGLWFLRTVRDRHPEVPVVLYTDSERETSGDREALVEGIETAIDRACATGGSHDHEDELERYRTIVESTGDPVYTLDAEGRITYANEALESMTGYDVDTLVGEHMSLLVPDADVTASEELIRDLLRDPERTNDTVELDIVCADGSRVRCENHIALLPYDDTFQGTAGAIRDITARRERKRELEAQNERLDRFASVVSHDLRNPLNLAKGHLELARERVGEDESLAQVGEALDRMDSLVADVLALAREGESVSDPERVPLADTALMAWASVETPAARLDVDTDATVMADRERLRRLFENLFRNSVEHGSTGSRVDADDDTDADGAAAAGDELTVHVGTLGNGCDDAQGFFVEDDGRGIPPDDRELVFEAGYSTSTEGTGFGLDIVRSISSAHGWEVALGDGDLGGARFEFHLPDGLLSV